MKRHYLLTLLAVYIAAMGVIGLIRTGSIVPLLITGGLALVTLVMALMARRGSRGGLVVATVWTGLNVLLYTYLAITPVSAHDPNRAGSEYIFGSMALIAAIVFFGLIGDLRRRQTPPNL